MEWVFHRHWEKRFPVQRDSSCPEFYKNGSGHHSFYRRIKGSERTEVIPEKRSAMDSDFEWITRELFSENLDFDYGDEELLAKYGSAEKDEQGALLRVGKAVYRRVLLAEGQAVRGSTRALLDAFISLGGEVFTAPAQLSAGEVVSAPDNITSVVRRFDGDIWLFLLNLSENEPARGDVKLSPELSGLCLEESVKQNKP